MFKKAAIRASVASIIAVFAAGLFSAAVDPETVPFGLCVGLFVVPSVLLFVWIEATGHTRRWTYTGFLAPVVVMVGLHLAALATMSPVGRGDGGDLMLMYTLECYVIGAAAALAWLTWRQTGRDRRK